MRYVSQRITIVNIRKPVEHTINQQLQWIGTSLGLFNLRDKDKSCFRLFIELVKAGKEGKPMTSDDLAAHLHLSRGTVIHHMNKLMDAGLVVRRGNEYILRVSSLSDLIEEVEKDVQRTLRDLRQVAEDIDTRLSR